MAQLTKAVRAPALGRGAATWRRTVAGLGGATIAVLAIGGLVLQIANGGAEAPNGRDYTVGVLVASALFGLPGAVLVARRTAGAIGPVSMAIGLSLGLAGAGTGWAVYTLETDPGSLPAGDAAVWLVNWIWLPGYMLIATFLLLLLPDGRLPSRRWRPLAAASGLLIALNTVAFMASEYPLEDMPRAFAGESNPLEVGAGEALGMVCAPLFAICALLSLASLVLRLRASTGVARDQLKWVALGGVATVVLLAGAFAAGSSGDLVHAAGMVPLPTAVAIAVLRHRMWDVDVVINRSLVYGALTVAVVALYVAVLSLAGQLLDETLAGIAAVALVAVALQPLHQRLQRAANQLVYGDRDDPAAALRRLGDRLVATGAGDEVLPAVAATVARALRLPYVEVSVDDGPSATHGTPAGDALRVTLLYQSARVGELVASPREPGRGFSRADRTALEAIGRQVAVAAHAVRLARDLQSSRERLVMTREEDRRRLRRDLHDELGPTLAALALELESAGQLVQTDPDAVGQSLERAASRARESVGEVRRLVHDLRPDTLDDLGLLGALRERALALSSGGLQIEVRGPADLGALPAAVEVAAYRIVSEALANAARHSGAGTCVAEIDIVSGELTLLVEDDGVGIAAPPGVGRRSMSERAEELGGSLVVDSSAGGGTSVRARLPLEAR